jgi:hypothetical protein
MKDQLLSEGAVAGHMNHIYDNGEMTFGELKQLLQAAVDGKLRGTEKTDGQNVFLSFDVSAQKARAIRNKGHIKAGGLTVDEFDDFFSVHPNQALRYSFVEALQAFEDVIKQLDKDTQLKIFGNKRDNIYFNTEVMNPGVPGAEDDDPRGAGTTNVIPYDKKTLLIHEVGHGMFDPNTALSYDDPESKKRVANCYSVLENALVGKSTEEPDIFSLETHPRRNLEKSGMKRASKVLPESIKAIDNVVSDFNLNDSNTIQDLVMVQIKPTIDSFGLTVDRNKALVLRLMGLCKSKDDPNKIVPCGSKDPRTGQPTHLGRATMRSITDGIPDELREKIKEFDDNFKYQDYTAALSSSLYEFTNAILEGFESSFIADNQKAIKHLQNEIKASIKKIQNSANEAAKEDLKKQLIKLQDVKNVNTPSEGFVFDYNNTTYKFTGWFAPSNQILGTERYGRFGPIEAAQDKEATKPVPEVPLRIGIAPGAYKPPHKGHLHMVNSLAEGNEETGKPPCDKVIVIISKPQLSGRFLPLSKKPVTADHAEQIWRAYIDKSPNKDKIVIIQSPAASPVQATYDFVMKESDPTDNTIAPPNATVVFGCGDKEDDAGRTTGFDEKARPDLTIDTQVCELEEKHTPGYIQLLQNNPAILKLLPSNQKESVEVEDLHASDMRYIIDIATEDPIGLSMLQDFVPQAVDALAVMGIMGLNPADQRDSEADQVQEPELDNPLGEIINQQASIFYESFKFKVRRAPKGKKSSGKFQRNMKKRLSKAHKTYLDTGRKDLAKFSGSYTKDRNKSGSNAFLAEKEIIELSGVSVGAGIEVSSQNQPTKPKRKKRIMLNKEEKRLRIKIREGLKKFFTKKSKEHETTIASILQEHELRLRLRNIIFEQSMILEQEDPTTDIHDSTGINTLKELLKNTSVLSSIRDVYMGITTETDQRKSFRAHIVQWIKDTLAPINLNDTESLDQTEPDAIAEDMGIDILGVEASPLDMEKFIPASDGSDKKKKKKNDDDDQLAVLAGEDTTGRNKAKRIYGNIETSIIDYYGELDNPKDQEMFYDYLIANMKLYFDKWENMMNSKLQEPESEEYDQAKTDTQDDFSTGI